MKLKTLRKRTGLTQTEMATHLGIAQSTISAYERGTRRLTLEAARDVIAVLAAHGVDASFEDLLPPVQAAP